MDKLSFSNVIAKNKEKNTKLIGPECRIRILSNIMSFQLNEFLEFTLREKGINTEVTSGNYDNILQDSFECVETSVVVVFWEMANIIDGFHYKACLMDKELRVDLVEKTKKEISQVLNNLTEVRQVFFNSFSSLVFDCYRLDKTLLTEIAVELNKHLKECASSNTLIVDIDKLFAIVSISKSVDFRYYYISKLLYKIEFYREYAKYIVPKILSIWGLTKKALIFDCDKTLWKGTIGEDGMEGIDMSSRSATGVVFAEIQHLALELKNMGVILGLCSKNNEEDINRVFSHADMKLRESDFAFKRVNWHNKVANIVEMANELNIDISSIVFVDDSDFEINLVKKELPQVMTIQVPKQLSEYPQVLRSIFPMFTASSRSMEDVNRSSMYHEEKRRKESKAPFNDLGQYLSSLKLKMKIMNDDLTTVPRLAQLTQKTNQFNLTTKRFTEPEIERYIKGSSEKVFCFNLSDNFGDYGITGLCIIVNCERDDLKCLINTFLMSCRVIGRNVEFVFMDYIIKHLLNSGIKQLNAKYVATVNNRQVENFYEKFGFIQVSSDTKHKTYELDLHKYKWSGTDYVEVENGR